MGIKNLERCINLCLGKANLAIFCLHLNYTFEFLSVFFRVCLFG